MKYVLLVCIALPFCRCTNPVSIESEAPHVTYITPDADETQVAINRKVIVTFSEAMDATSFASTTFFLQDGAITIAGTITCSGNSATFIPARNLTPNTMFVAYITTRVKDISGNPLKNLQKWSFTTGTMADSAAPSINSIFPASTSIGVALDRKISATFSETIDSLSITTFTFSLHQDTAVVPGSVSCTGSIATFIPVQNLSPNQTYTATLTTGIEDLTGNAMARDHVWSFTTSDALAGQSPVSLGSAYRFAVLAQSVYVVGRSMVSGDLGSYPDSSISGFPPGTSTGAIFPGDAVAAAAWNDMDSAYTDLTARPASSAAPYADDLGGMVIIPGTYRFSSSLKIESADVTLNAQGDPNAIFVFQTPLSLVVSSGRKVILVKGARSGNIFWRVESAELGATSALKGTILADQSITLHSGAILDGRAFSKRGTASLDTCSIHLAVPQRQFSPWSWNKIQEYE